MPIYEYHCKKCGTIFELRSSYYEIRETAECPKCKAEAEKIISGFACKTGVYIKGAEDVFRSNTLEKPKMQKIDLRTIIITVAFMLFILLLVTLLMPRNNVVGIFLQTLAGLIFVVDQIWEKIIPRDYMSKLPGLLEQESFRQKLPLISIPITTAVALIIYYKNSSAHLQWFEAFFSMCLAVSFANAFYFLLLGSIPKWFQKIRHRKGQVKNDTPLNHPLRSNWTLLIASTIGLICGSLIIFPLSRVRLGTSNFAALPLLIYLSLVAIIAYGWLLSIIYLISYGLLKFGYSLSRIRVNIADPDRIFIRRMTWAFLLLFWLWGGILLILNTR